MQEFDPQYESDYLDNITGDDDMDNTVQKPNIFSVGDLLDMDLPEIKWLLYPFIPQKGVCMISAPRGVGKSFLAMTMAISIASSIDFLGFKTEQQYKVLYIDGEMNGKMLHERFAKLIDGMEKDGATVNRDNLKIFGCDFQGRSSMPDMSKPTHWRIIENAINSIGGVDLIILDNVFTLYGCQDENAASSWQAFNRWSVSQRIQNRSVLWIHHTGKDTEKGGRGSSAIETLMDSSILLKRPAGYDQQDGAAVVVEYTKSRSVAGDAVAKFAIKLCGTDNILYWTVAKTDEQSELDDLLDFVDNKGMDVSEISKETGMSKSALYRKFQAAGIKDVSARAKLAKQKQAEDTKSLIDI